MIDIENFTRYRYYNVLNYMGAISEPRFFSAWAIGMNKKKQEIITFKADDALMKVMKGMPNRSEFIRNAILASLKSICPVCKGTGVLTPHQKEHMDELLVDHTLEECETCHEIHMVCHHVPETGNDKHARK